MLTIIGGTQNYNKLFYKVSYLNDPIPLNAAVIVHCQLKNTADSFC
jgi:hypothetical protein